MRKLFLAALLAFASPAIAQDTTIVASPGDSLVITTTTTTSTVVRVIPGEVIPPPVDTTTPPPVDTIPPPVDLVPIVRVAGVVTPTSVPADQVPDLVAGTICFAYDATFGGILSRDANGFGVGEGGHLDVQLRGGLLQIRSQTTNASFSITANGLGEHRGCYRWGSAMTLFLDGALAASNPHTGSMKDNLQDVILGATCWQCVQGTISPLANFLNGPLSELEIFDVPMTDEQMEEWSFFEDTTVVIPPPPPPTGGNLVIGRIDSLTTYDGRMALMIRIPPVMEATQVVTYVDGVEQGRIEAKVRPCYPSLGLMSSSQIAELGGRSGWRCYDFMRGVECYMANDEWHASTPCHGRTARFAPETRGCDDPYFNYSNRWRRDEPETPGEWMPGYLHEDAGWCWVEVNNSLLVKSALLPIDGQAHTFRVDLLDMNGIAFATFEDTWPL